MGGRFGKNEWKIRLITCLFIVLVIVAVLGTAIGAYAFIKSRNIMLPEGITVMSEQSSKNGSENVPNKNDLSGDNSNKNKPAENDSSKTESAKSNKAEDTGQYILPMSQNRKLNKSDISELSTKKLRLARNEIYARHGRLFKDEGLQKYFNNQNWYNGHITPKNFVDAEMLSKIERYNVKFIKNYENAVLKNTKTVAKNIDMGHIKRIYASTSLSEYNMTHSPERAIDGKLSTAWVEGASGQGIGENLLLMFDDVYTVRGFRINAGYHKNSDLYMKNSRPKEITAVLSDGTKKIFKLEDVMEQQDISFPSPVETESLTIIINSVYAGNKYEDAVISELLLY